MNLFIESIEGGTYLAAIDDGSTRDYLKDNKSKPKAFHCLNEIREHLSGRSFERVTLRQSTPYDEMCGMDSGSQSLDLELEW